MDKIIELEQIAINVKSHKILKQLLYENPKLEQIMRKSNNKTEAIVMMKSWVMNYLKSRPNALKFYNGKNTGREQYNKLSWRDYAAIRLLDYIDNAGRKFEDLNLRGDITGTNPIKNIWMAVKFGTGGAETDFFKDMLHLFRQFSGKVKENYLQKKKFWNG